MNINIEIPDDLHKRLKIAAITSDLTLKEHIIATLGARLREAQQ